MTKNSEALGGTNPVGLSPSAERGTELSCSKCREEWPYAEAGDGNHCKPRRDALQDLVSDSQPLEPGKCISVPSSPSCGVLTLVTPFPVLDGACSSHTEIPRKAFSTWISGSPGNSCAFVLWGHPAPVSPWLQPQGTQWLWAELGRATISSLGYKNPNVEVMDISHSVENQCRILPSRNEIMIIT